MFLFKQINSCNIFIGLYALYIYTSAFQSGPTSGLLLLMIVAISFAYFLFILFRIPQPKLLKCLSFLLLYFAIYGLIYIVSGRHIYNYAGLLMNNNDYLKNIAASLLPVYPFYYFARKGQLNRTMLTFWLPVFFLLAVVQFIQYQSTLLQRALEAGSSATEFTNNQGYVFVSLLPLLFIKNKHRLLQLILIGACAIFIVAAVKRGGILIGGVTILFYFYQILFKSKEKGKGKIIFLLVCATLVAGYYISDFIAHSDYFTYRLNNTLEGNTSGRDTIYERIWTVFKDFDLFSAIFGEGAYSSIYYTGMMAHNDWLEILLNQGILGICIYAYYFKVMYRTWRKNSRNSIIGIAMGALFITLFLKTLFSMSYSTYTLYTCAAYGLCMAEIERKEQSRKYGKRIAQ